MKNEIKAAIFFIVLFGGGCHVKTSRHETSNENMALYAANGNHIQEETIHTFKGKAMDTVKIKESEDGSICMEQIGNSIYIRYYKTDDPIYGKEDYTVRYMDVTQIIDSKRFIHICKKIEHIGNYEMVQKPNTDIWSYDHKHLGEIAVVYDFYEFFGQYPRHEIGIDGYSFIYYPKGFDRGIDDFLMNHVNFNVPNYQEGHVYVRNVYQDHMDLMTDEELLNASKIQIQNLMGITE